MTIKNEILKLTFKKKEEIEKETTSNLNPSNKETPKIEESKTLKGIPQIISTIKPQNSAKVFRKKTYIPQKNENKFAPKPNLSQNRKPKTPFSRNTTNKPINKPPVSIGLFQSSIQPTIEKKTFDINKKKKNTKKESTKPKINNQNYSLRGKTFFGRIEATTLEDPEFIKIKKNRKSTLNNKETIFIPKTIELDTNITLKELATKLSLKLDEVIEQARNIGFDENELSIIDINIIEIIAESFGHKIIRKDVANKEKLAIYDIKIEKETAINRPPIISIVGHIDHGKTSLLDKIQNSNITKTEIGGITQKIGTHFIKTKFGEITFLDTPGHSAFFNMIERGINISDITLLIISGVEGIKEQTEEAIKYIKKNNINFIVVVTKADLPGFNIEKIKQELTKYEILVKDYGGEIELIEISALTGKNIDSLLKTIINFAETLNLKYNKKSNAIGVILESKINNKTGVLTTLLIQQGTLNVGDSCVSQTTFGKIKRICDENNKILKSASASMIVEVLGFNECPIPGKQFAVTKDQTLINDLIKYQNNKNEEKIENILIKPSISKLPCMNLILKSDSIGSLDALNLSLKALKTKLSTYKIISKSIGNIKESDIELAKISNATILNFNISIDKNIEQIIKNEKISIISSKIIYKITEEVEQKLNKLIKLIEKEVYIGSALVLKIFKSSKIGNISGCNVKSGKIIKNGITKIFRKDKLIFEGKIESLYREKNETKEVKSGFDCGIYTGFNEIKEGDEIKCYQIEYEKPKE